MKTILGLDLHPIIIRVLSKSTSLKKKLKVMKKSYKGS